MSRRDYLLIGIFIGLAIGVPLHLIGEEDPRSLTALALAFVLGVLLIVVWEIIDSFIRAVIKAPAEIDLEIQPIRWFKKKREVKK